MKHAREGKVSKARMYRHTQSNWVWETCRVMSLCGATRGCGLFTQGAQISWVCLVERGRSHHPEQTVVYFHSAGLTNSQAARSHSLSPFSCTFLQRFEARLGGEATSSTGKWKRQEDSSREKPPYAAMKDKVRRGGGRNQAKTGENSCNVFFFCAPLSPFFTFLFLLF